MAVLLVGAALYLVSKRKRDSEPAELIHLPGRTMTTSYSVKVVAPEFSRDARRRLKQVVEQELETVDAALSRYRDGSELNRLNRSRSNEPIEVSRPLLEVLSEARRIGKLSGGAYDVTVGPLIELWGFDGSRTLEKAPAEPAITGALSRVGFDLWRIDEDKGALRKLNPEVDIDLSSIAKGYAVDRIALGLERMGHRDYLVEVGGEIRCSGSSPQRRPWRVAVEAPVVGRREVYEVLQMRRGSMATSGDYRNFYELEGRRVSHTIDPRNGRPVEHDLRSVTVIHESCTTADGLATALEALGPDAGYELAVREKLAVLMLVGRGDQKIERLDTLEFRRMVEEGVEIE
ncbi:MAG: FAD:protein FMN transferase [Polyangia bacterium]